MGVVLSHTVPQLPETLVSGPELLLVARVVCGVAGTPPWLCVPLHTSLLVPWLALAVHSPTHISISLESDMQIVRDWTIEAQQFALACWSGAGGSSCIPAPHKAPQPNNHLPTMLSQHCTLKGLNHSFVSSTVQIRSIRG